ncbi:MAG TPA: spore coat U domain-containing protein [Allosphingosinicella sp.]|nr:spore coat U domain-containing protein [Allosphingosinicella sp.]
MTGLQRLMLLKSLLFAGLLSLAAMVAPAPAEAAITCTVTTAGITFSAYDTVNKPAVDSTGTITVACQGGSGAESLSLNLTGGAGGSCTSRQMRNGAASLGYQIYQNAARTSNFCDAGSRMDIVIDFASGPNQSRNYLIYGRVTANQTPATWGSYSDTLTLTVKKGGGTVGTGSVPVNGSVSPTCSVSSGTLGFGTYASASAALSTATVSVNCSSGAPYQVSLGPGQNVSSSVRRMAGPGGSFLTYQLYSNSLRTLAWGDGTALGAKVNGTGSGSAQSLTVYGRVPAGQSVRPGSYSDSVLVTVDY